MDAISLIPRDDGMYLDQNLLTSWPKYFPELASIDKPIPTDVSIKDNLVTVATNLENFKKGDIKLSYNDGFLEIEAHYSDVDSPDKSVFGKINASTKRAVLLPRGADLSHALASFENGILKVEMPFHESETSGLIKVT